MFIKNLRKEFYDVLIGQRCVIFVNLDIDAICACKILQTLFRCDNVLYTIVPVRGISDLKKAYDENNSEVKYFLLVNCGGTLDILELFEPEEHHIFYIVDSHRPIDVCNVYSTGQVSIFGDVPEDVPEFDDIFCDDSDEDNEEDEEDPDLAEDSDSENTSEDPASKRQRLNERKLLKRREKRIWEERRDKLIFEYSQFSYYGKSSALLIFELAWKMSKDTMDLLWWAIVGVTEQMLFDKIENSDYVLKCQLLHEHVSRLTHSVNNQNINNLRLTFDKDLRLAMYRHWTVESSMRYTMYTSCQMKLWTLRGENRLYELLADMGLPLAQSKQNFNAMDLVLRKEFLEVLEKFSSKYGLDDIIYGSFTLQYGYRIKYCASDFVYSILGILETMTKDKKPEDCFLDAMDFLSGFKKGTLNDGIEKAKIILRTIYKQVQYSLEMRSIYAMGPFIYLEVQEGNLDTIIFSHPHCLSLLAHFALRAYAAASRNRKASILPLVCTAPIDNEICLVIGIPPVAEDSLKNLFGKAFEKAASTSNSSIETDYFDSSVIRLSSKDRTKFFDALVSLLS